MTTPTTGTIYALLDPRTNDVRYVGQTTKPIQVRLAGHLAAPAPLVKAWIEDLAVEGRLPQIVPLREDVPAEELGAAEKEEIEAHSARGEILNIASNSLGNARRRKASAAEQKRRDAEEKAMDRAWRQASWRQVADQIRAATGGPISPVDIPIHDIPAAIWSAYEAYHEADRYLGAAEVAYTLAPGGGLRIDESRTPNAQEVVEARRRRLAVEPVLQRYFRRYCAAFAAVDTGEGYGGKGAFCRGEDEYKKEFADPVHMARYLSFIPWAARALDPWVIMAEEAGMDAKGEEFLKWVSDDDVTREVINLCRAGGVRTGVLRQSWDRDVAAHALAVGAAHVPDFIVPDLLRALLEKTLVELTRERQATREMCLLLQSLNPEALDTVYGTDELAASDEALGLPPGTSAQVVRQVYGRDLRDPGNRTGKLLQRHSGDFGTAGVPGYSGWEGPHVPAYRVTAACFYRAGLLPDAQKEEGDTLMEQVTHTWKPTRRGLEHLIELEEEFKVA